MNIPFPPLKEEVDATAKTKQQKKQQDKAITASSPTEPEYTVLHRGEFAMQDYTNSRQSTLIKRPRELVVSVQLPGVESAGKVDLDIFEKKLVLISKKPNFKLDVSFGT